MNFDSSNLIMLAILGLAMLFGVPGAREKLLDLLAKLLNVKLVALPQPLPPPVAQFSPAVTLEPAARATKHTPDELLLAAYQRLRRDVQANARGGLDRAFLALLAEMDQSEKGGAGA